MIFFKPSIMKSLSVRSFACFLIIFLALTSRLHAHGDVTPQAVDTHTLPALGNDWKDANPYCNDTAVHKEAVRIGTSGFAQNCARCHGLDAVSGGIAPDLRKFDAECIDLADPTKQAACIKEMDAYYLATVRRGRARDGRVYMPPFENVLTQEALWAIKTYLETRRSNP
jgi:cytochrome c-550 PedF